MEPTIRPIPPPPQNFASWVGHYLFSGITGSLDNFRQARQHGDKEKIADAVLEHINAHASFYAFCLNTIRFISQVLITISEGARHVFSIFKTSSFILTATVCGFITNAITAVQEIIGIIRESRILFFLHKESDYENSPKILTDDLQKLSRYYTISNLETRLRPWFMQKHGLTSISSLQQLIQEVTEEHPYAKDYALGLVKELHTLAIKKLMTHTFGLVAIAVSVAGLIGFLIVCPPATIIILLILGSILNIIRSMIWDGYVDNPEDGFSLSLCFPVFIVNLICSTRTNKSEPQHSVKE